MLNSCKINNRLGSKIAAMFKCAFAEILEYVCKIYHESGFACSGMGSFNYTFRAF